MGLGSEFKEFALNGSFVDMAVGIIIGAATGTVVTSLVGDILNPIIGTVMGGTDFSNMGMVLKEAVGEAPAVMIKYGAFIQSIINFLIVAFVIFMIVRAINSMKKAAAEEPAEPTTEETLLTEIRDLLAKN